MVSILNSISRKLNAGPLLYYMYNYCAMLFCFSVYSVSEVFSLYFFVLPDRCHPPLNFTLDTLMARNAASTAWVIFNPSNEFLDAKGIFLSRATNNLAQYEAVIALMTNASALGIRSLVVRLDSELVISLLTSHYTVRHPVLYWKYLRVHFLERSFDVISYEHIPRTSNSLADSLANDILD